ncbi:RabGAP/TBC [Hesseltinella vesiculosa]|uniref:RabGAP/TBC n=1 Tax=Hesseltinella vesiculosa TaxID=101127 RepID=A0A1X2GB48_9FUNG|nr:RabGAP/TBC [Hesseltinella vesiculosa]
MHDLTHIPLGVKTSLASRLARAQRISKLRKAAQDEDFTLLRHMAREPEGFVEDAYRRMIWPVLLRTHHGAYVDEKGSPNGIADPIQISKDVERSLYYYPQDITPTYKAFKQQELQSMIIEILWRNPRLRYYQGFHDICTVFLLVLGKKAAIPAAENVALFFVRDAMLDSFEPVSKQLRLMVSIVEYEDPSLMHYLETHGIMPYYALSWLLTWFSHDMTDFSKITRLFDLFVSSSSMMPLYVASAITLLRREELLHANPEYLHSLITHIPQDTDIEAVIQRAVRLEAEYPALQVQKQSGIWLHDESTLNTWQQDWGTEAGLVPDRLRIDTYLGKVVPIEEWEDELLAEWCRRNDATKDHS